MQATVKSAQWVCKTNKAYTIFLINIYLFIFLFIQFINQQWHRSTSNDIEIQTGRKANAGLTNHLCAAKKNK